MDPGDKHPHASAFIEQEIRALLNTLVRKDDLVPETLRVHLLVESHLERIMLALLPRGNRLIRNGRLNFVQKLRIVEALTSEDAPVFAALRRLNQLRNKCAHDRNKVVSADDLSRIGEAMGPSFEEIRSLHSASVTNLASAVFGEVYGSLSAMVYHAEFSDRARGE